MVRIQISPRPKRPPRTLNDAGLTTARKRLFSLCVGSADERSVCNRLWIQALGYKYSGLTRPGGPCAPATPSCFCLICVQAKPQLWSCRQGSLHWRNCVQRCGSHLARAGRRRQQRGDPTSVSLGPSAIADGNGKPRLAYAHLSVLRTLRAQDPSLPPPTHSFRCPSAILVCANKNFCAGRMGGGEAVAQGLHLGRDHGAGLAPDHWLHGALVRSFWRHKVDLPRPPRCRCAIVFYVGLRAFHARTLQSLRRPICGLICSAPLPSLGRCHITHHCHRWRLVGPSGTATRPQHEGPAQAAHAVEGEEEVVALSKFVCARHACGAAGRRPPCSARSAQLPKPCILHTCARGLDDRFA